MEYIIGFIILVLVIATFQVLQSRKWKHKGLLKGKSKN